MFTTAAILLASTLSLTTAAETVLGVYIFSRHGDRTAKLTPPSNLTDLGYEQVFTSGTYFRDRYVAQGATSRIQGLNTDLVKLSQLSVSAPLDNVLMSSAVGFLQGLYPPTSFATEKLRNGQQSTAPLNGYQIIPIQQTTSGTGSEDTAWLQGATNCANAVTSSNKYFNTNEFKATLQSTQGFYSSVAPMVNGTYNSSQVTFLNAYTIFDLLNVASIHNATFPSNDLLTNSTLFQLRTLADTHEFNLAFNASEPIRAIAGSTLAAQIVQGLNTTITGGGKQKITIQFGAYGSFQSFFGLANLTSANSDFFGVPDYTSTMTFELYTDAAPSPFPATSELRVRFLFHNGTTSNSSQPTTYPLFGGSALDLSWQDFTNGMQKFAIGDQKDWCQACGNTTGVCADATSSSSSNDSNSASASSSDGSGNGMSLAVAGVIGAMVTLAVILGVEGLILLVGGLRLVNKNRLGGGQQIAAGTTKA